MSARVKRPPFTGPQELFFRIWVEEEKGMLARVFVPLEKRKGGFVDVEELTAHTGLCARTIRRELAEFNLPSYLVRGRRIIAVSDVQAWLSARKKG